MNLKPANYMGDAIGFILLVMILFSSRQSRKTRIFVRIIFAACVITTAVLCLLDIVVFAVDGVLFPGARAIAYFGNTLQAILLTSVCYLWTLYVRHKTGIEKQGKPGRGDRILAVPLLFVTALYLVNLFVPVCFVIDAGNVYSRHGIGFILAMLIDSSYLLGSSFAGIHAIRRSKSYQFFPIMFFELASFTGVVLQMVFYGISLIYISIAVALVGVYFALQKEAAYIDPLSGAFNRMYMNSYLYAICRDYQKNAESYAKRSMQLACLLLDVDGFKQINDTYGHLQGDQAIRDIGALLLDSMPQNAVCARYGGDEFVVIVQICDVREIDEMIAELHARRRALNQSHKNPYQLHFSVGCALFDPGNDTPETMMKRLDDKMYQEKRERHARYGEGRQECALSQAD